MRTLTLLTVLTASTLLSQSKDFSIKSLNKRYDSGINSTSKMNLSKKQFIDKAICLKNHYNFNFNEMQEFLTKKEYKNKFNEDAHVLDNTYSKIYQSSIDKKSFSKCYK